MALPLLPGNAFNKNLGKTKFHKSHHLDYTNEVAVIGEEKPGIGGERLPFQRMKPNNSAIPRGNHGPDQPAWVAFDKQVLAFDAYYHESVTESPMEQYRVHKCRVFFYLEDDSLQIVEPKLKNSGVPQGTIIRRHRVPRPAPYNDQFYTVEDMNVGAELSVYARTFKIVDCDEFTHNFLRKLGVRVNPPLPVPGDPYTEQRRTVDDGMSPLRPYEKRDTLRQFMDHDRQVLRFHCYWDDRDRMFGDPRHMVLHYYLADDTIEVREVIPPNAGRDAVPMFLHRCRLPKTLDPLPRPGQIADRTVLNVFGPMGHGGRYILDSLKTGEVKQDFYGDSDLMIGRTVNVFGRPFLICDCDEFTKEYYRTKYGITEFVSISTKESTDTQPPKPVERQTPAYNGFGSEEDSLNSCNSLIPKPPKRDFLKFMSCDKNGLDSNVLRFMARFDNGKATEADRRFIISYYMSDDTLVIFENAEKNSGLATGKFLERSKVKKPSGEFYTATDLYVGATVSFNGHKFRLIDADDYAYNFMEKNASEFPNANIQLICSKLRSDINLSALANVERLPVDQFCAAMTQLTGGRLTDHEVITLARHYQHRPPGDDGINQDSIVAVIQDQLKRGGFEEFGFLEAQCLHFDFERRGLLDPERLRMIFLSMKVPVQQDFVRALLANLTQSGQVDYRTLLRLINWRTHQVSLPSTLNISCHDTTDFQTGCRDDGTLVQCVNVRHLMEDIGARK